MSEEILKALMQLFAIISKQDDGVTESIRKYVENFLRFQLTEEGVRDYLALFDEFSKDKERKTVDREGENIIAANSEVNRSTRTSMTDSVKTLAICKKINKTLSSKQKIVVFVRLWELLWTNKQYTAQRIQILNTVAEVFNIVESEYKELEVFCSESYNANFSSENFLYIRDLKSYKIDDLETVCKTIDSDGLNGCLTIVRVSTSELYFIKYEGSSELFLNGLIFNTNNIYLFAPGSTLRLPQGTVYYSDVVARFLSDKNGVEIAFNVSNLEYTFPNGKLGLQDVNLSEGSGNLVAIMGASGAGKTTLLNVLSGIEYPSAGSVILNGINIHTEKDKVQGLIGYIAQDDLLIDELSVFENLYYNAKLCFKNKTKEDLVQLVHATLLNLGLYEVRDIKVGNPLNKKISGGQRKRLNIALELIREPSVLFVDEPTSGLSSRDSENVMDLLKELSLKGKLIFVVIHQPSSDIYKMFDKLFLLDTGGYPIYYNNPIEAVMYFKRQTNQVKSDVGECNYCGNVNPELLFNLLEAKVVDDYGNFKNERKIKPTEWYSRYKNNFSISLRKNILQLPENILSIPNKLSQYTVFVTRDVKSKISNVQYLLINLLEAPVLALILAFLIKYSSSDSYQFSQNDNLPAYIFICIVVVLFIGLTVSAEEIFRDKKILKREQFLNLSKFSYLMSKVSILFLVSAIQAALFVLIGNSILEIQGMFFPYWLVLFTVSCFANILGLNISISFNSAVTIYIIIPLLVIPQMILGGAMFSFDKINKHVGGGKDVTPLVADFFASRWAFEALTVNQFKNNEYEKYFYKYDKLESQLNYKTAYYLPKLKNLSEETKSMLSSNKDSLKTSIVANLAVIKNEIKSESEKSGLKFNSLDKLQYQSINAAVLDEAVVYFEELNVAYGDRFLKVEEKRNRLLDIRIKKAKGGVSLLDIEKQYTNENLNDLVFKTTEKNKVTIENNRLVQNIDPIYKDPSPVCIVDFRTHIFAPKKHFLGMYFSTFYFNMMVIWGMSFVLFLTLYFETYNGIVNFIRKALK